MMIRQAELPLPTERSFGIMFAVVFALVGAWMLWKGSAYWSAALAAAAIFLLAALAFPKALRPLNTGWMHVGLQLNRVVSPVVMGLIFFGLLTPVAAFLRLRGRDALQREFEPARKSYWIKREPPGPDGSTFPLQF